MRLELSCVRVAVDRGGFLLRSGCASRPDWIEAPLGGGGGERCLVGRRLCARADPGGRQANVTGPLDRRRLPVLATEQPDEG